MNLYRKNQIMKQLQFNQLLLWLASLVLAIISLTGGRFQVNSVWPWLTLLSLASTIIHHFLYKQFKKDQETGPTSKLLAWLSVFSLLYGNLFSFTSGAAALREEHSAGYEYSVQMIVVDYFVLATTLLNLFKPFIANGFWFMIGLLILTSLFHIFILVKGEKFHTCSKSGQVLVQILLIATALLGNLLALFVLIDLRRQNDPAFQGRRRTSVIDKLTRNAAAMLGLTFIVFLVMISVTSIFSFSEVFAIDNHYDQLLQDPSFVFPFGTDNFGRDVFSRIILGARISLGVGFLSTIIPFAIGGGLGAVAGYYGGRVDNLIMRLLDVLYAIPGLILAMTIVGAFGASTTNLIIALSVGAIPAYARTMRADVLQVVNYEYVESAFALGQSDWNILKKHIIPNSMASMIVRATLTIGTAVISTSSLSFLGLGVEPHIPEWGNILQTGSDFLETDPHLAIFPGLAIMLLVLAFNFLGDGLRDASDPKTD